MSDNTCSNFKLSKRIGVFG